jgi:Flp pilus assembly protein TadD
MPHRPVRAVRSPPLAVRWFGSGVRRDPAQPSRTGPARQIGRGAADWGGVRTDHLLDQAGDLLLHGRAGKAAHLLTPVVGEEPGNVGAWQLLARAHLDLGASDAALTAARSALRLDPGGLESLYLVSAAYSATGRHEPAIAAATAGHAEDPGNPRLAERLGRAYLAAGRVGEAENSLRASAEFAYYDADLQVAHGVALFAAGRPLSAREAYGRALRLEPSHVRAHLELRRLTTAERGIVDAASMVRISDAYAESLRVPPGGTTRVDRRALAAHVAGVVLAVSLLALLVLGVVDVVSTAVVPAPLTLSLLTLAMGAAGISLLTRRPH